MNELIGKKLVMKNNPNSPTKTIQNVENGMVHFSDNEKVPLNRLDDLFTENVSVTKIDPDSFFNNSSMSSIATDYMSHVNNPTQASPVGRNTPINGSSMAEAPKEMIIDSQPVTNPNLIPQNLQEVKKTPQEKLMEDDWVKAQFTSDGKMRKNVSSENIRRITSEELRDELESDDYRPGLNNSGGSGEQKDTSKSNDLTNKTQQSSKSTDTLNENKKSNIIEVKSLVDQSGVPPMFQTMKKNKKVKIGISLEEMIPNIESIKHLNDMFNFDITIVDHLANEITDNLLKDPNKLQQMISEELSKMINKKRRKPSGAKK